MLRTRNIKRWNVESYDYESPEHFLSLPRKAGIHAIQHKGKMLDILVQDRGATTTLVVFSGAVSMNLKTTPAFFGLSLAEDTGVNLIAVADPSLEMGEITVAWYLGNSHTGPLREILSKLIGHVADSLGGSRLILFGSSGGGYAAAHLAHDFPGSIALVWNPRLSLERWSEKPLRLYLKNCLKHTSSGHLTAKDREVLAAFGPTEISDLNKGPLNHNLLIYHNLLDPHFLNLQLFPFLDATAADPRIKIQFSLDKLGHGGAPAQQARSILGLLAQSVEQEVAISNAGFLPRLEATDAALRKYPEVAFRMQQTEKAYDALQVNLDETERLRAAAVVRAEAAVAIQISLQERAQTAESLHRNLEAENAQWRAENKDQQAEIDSLMSVQTSRRRFLRHPAARKVAKIIPMSLKSSILRRLI